MAGAAIRFDGKVILVTGAGYRAGFGLAAGGARIVVADNGAALDGI